MQTAISIAAIPFALILFLLFLVILSGGTNDD